MLSWLKQQQLLKFLGCLLLVCAGFFSAVSIAATNQPVLKPDQAFNFMSFITPPKTVLLKWHIAKGYYLYRESISVTENAKPVKIKLPQGELKSAGAKDSELVFSGELKVEVPMTSITDRGELVVKYQGCSKEGFCYPPMKRTLAVDLVNQVIIQQVASKTSNSNILKSFLTSQNKVHEVLSNGHKGSLMLLFLGIGLLLAFTPCVLPMIPILMSIIVGHQQITTRKAFFLSLAYVLGVAIMYSMAGIFSAWMGSSLQVWLQKPIFALLGGLIFILLAMSLFDVFQINISRLWQHRIAEWSNKQKRGTYVGVFLMGVMSVLLVSPCVTAPLVGVLMYIAQTGDELLGFLALFAMGIGMGIPLMLVGMSAGKYLPRRGPWMEAVRKLFGFVLIVMAVWMVSRSGVFQPVTQHFLIQAEQTEPAKAKPFILIHDLNEFNRELASAAESSKPVMLDFYADWCESCVVMDKQVFNKDNVKKVLSPFTVLRIDLTSNSANDQEIMKLFGVMAPPTILFFDHKGQEVNSQRIVGELGASEFINRIDTFISAGCYTNLRC